MNEFKNAVKPCAWFAAALLVITAVACGGGNNTSAAASPPTAPGVGPGAGGTGKGPAPVNLGAAGNFAILAESAITNVPTSAITGDVGLSPATGAGIGLTCAQVTGITYDVNNTGPLPCTVVDPRSQRRNGFSQWCRILGGGFTLVRYRFERRAA